jgi:hypothetical protein
VECQKGQEVKYLLLAVLACGAPVVPDVPHLEPGHYNANVWVTEKTGACTWVPDAGSYAVDVDSAGALKSPLEPLVKCQTDYDAEGMSIACNGLGLKASAREAILPGSRAWGTGTVTGDFDGCKGLGFELYMVPK